MVLCRCENRNYQVEAAQSETALILAVTLPSARCPEYPLPLRASAPPLTTTSPETLPRAPTAIVCLKFTPLFQTKRSATTI
jgi:hypothetical protein